MDLVLQIVNNPSGAGGVGGGTGGGGTACHPGLLWCGISGRQLGKVEPNTSLVLDLKMIALQSGLQVGAPRLDPRGRNQTVSTLIISHGVTCYARMILLEKYCLVFTSKHVGFHCGL